MSEVETNAPVGMLVPWKLPDANPVFLDDENFYLLADQAQIAQTRAALARGVGAYWRQGGYRLPGLHVEARGEDLLVRVTGERYAGFTAAGMAVHGEAQEWLFSGPFEDGLYVVGLRADCHPKRSAAPEIVVNRLPVGPMWLSCCLPLGLFQKRARQLQRIHTDWDLRAVTLAELRADSANREDAAYGLCQELSVLVSRLLPLVRERLRALLDPLLLVSLLATLRDELSLAVRWKEVVRACRALDAVRWHFSPFDVRPAEFLQEDFGLVAAHFIEPALSLLQWMKHVVGQLLAAAQADADFPYDTLRSSWWSDLGIGDMQLLPALHVKEWGPKVLRVARLISVGRHDAETGRWSLALHTKSHSFSEHVILVMLPSSEKPWDTRNVQIRIEPSAPERPYHTLRFAAGRPWAAYWLPGGIKTMTDAVRIIYQAPMPELSACLLWEVVDCRG